MTCRAAVAAVVLGMALAVIPASPAGACSCGEGDPASRISLVITNSEVSRVANPWGGEAGGDMATVDLRGASLEVLGTIPARLGDRDLAEVPVLAAVLLDPNMQDSCGTPQIPAVGSDLKVEATVIDDPELIIYSGPCSGTFTVTAAPAPEPELPDQSPVVPVAVGGAGVALVAVLVLRSRRS
ncbi:MAG: hypothetical protein Q8K72_18385 [Acidimicrobiales bacterium]|nr:hypothetical protein [Acidimicrobiales bacterium]